MRTPGIANATEGPWRFRSQGMSRLADAEPRLMDQ